MIKQYLPPPHPGGKAIRWTQDADTRRRASGLYPGGSLQAPAPGFGASAPGVGGAVGGGAGSPRVMAGRGVADAPAPTRRWDPREQERRQGCAGHQTGERGGHGLGWAASRLLGYTGSHTLERLPKAFTTLCTARLTTRQPSTVR
jgi:hypothetical protein